LTSSDFGAKLKARRRAKGLTLKQLAEMTRLSVGLLSEVERGLAQPSMSSLKKIAQALGFSLFDSGEETKRSDVRLLRSSPRTERALLHNDHEDEIQIVRAGKRKKLIYPRIPAVFELLTPDLNRAYELLYVKYKRGFTSGTEPIVDPPGEKCVFILSGCLELKIRGKTVQLHKGDSVSYPSNAPVSLRVIGEEACQAVCFGTPPTF
jgi:transcriptional regulator with XRE-family HTH domain